MMSEQKKIDLSALSKKFDKIETPEAPSLEIDETPSFLEEETKKTVKKSKKVVEKMKEIIDEDFIHQAEEEAEEKIRNWKDEILEKNINDQKNWEEVPVLWDEVTFENILEKTEEKISEEVEKVEEKIEEIKEDISAPLEEEVKNPVIVQKDFPKIVLNLKKDDKKTEEIEEKEEKQEKENKTEEKTHKIVLPTMKKEDLEEQKVEEKQEEEPKEEKENIDFNFSSENEIFSNYKSDFEDIEKNSKNSSDNNEEEEFYYTKKHKKNIIVFLAAFLIFLLTLWILSFIFKDKIFEKFKKWTEKVKNEIENLVDEIPDFFEESDKTDWQDETMDIWGYNFDIKSLEENGEKFYKYKDQDFIDLQDLKNFLENEASKLKREDDLRKAREINMKTKIKVKEEFLED